MRFSSIMVGVNLYSSDKGPIRIAADLASRFEAKLIGIAAAQVPWSLYTQEAQSLEVVEQMRSEIERKSAEAEKRFRSAVVAQSRRQIEWRSAIAQPTDYIAHQARAADLIVVSSRQDRTFLDSSVGDVNPGDLIMRAGRPVLVVPPEAEQLNLKCAVLAWKDTREARRAASDSLPLLQKVRDVIVAEVIEDESQRHGAHGRLDDMVIWLSRHGINASSRVFDFPEGNDPVEMLWEYGADIVVAGGYGHTRLREWIFGGFTDSLLKQSPRCVFMAH